jgi:hypothetical protein
MNAQSLLENLQKRGAALQINGAVVRVSPSSILTDDDRALIRAFKPALLELLLSEAPEKLAEVGAQKREKEVKPVVVVPAVLPPRVLLAAARRIDARLVLTTAERFELSLALACLDCGIDPQSC